MLKIKKNIGLTFDDVLLIPQKSGIATRGDVDLTSSLTPKIKLKLPIISANMDTVTEHRMAIALAEEGGVGVIHRFLSVTFQADEVKKVKDKKLLVGGAVGIRDDYLERTAALINAGCDFIVIDIAHGHSTHETKVLRELVRKFPKMEFVAGNVATAAGTKELIKNGAAAVKVGIGPGALCTTRIVAGSGVPQLTAISECADAAKKFGIPIIADGGVRTSGDIVKALAAGAGSVMIGSLFAGCEESPALAFFRDNRKFKITRGMASLLANHERQLKDGVVKKDLKDYSAEGVEAVVPYRGSVVDLLRQMAGGVRSGFSYSGARNCQELARRARFIQISQSSLIESDHHDVSTL